MLRLEIQRPTDRPLRVLALGAHSDDIEIGCGGTILRWLESMPGTHVTWVVVAAKGPRADEARASASSFLEGAGRSDVRVQDFRDGFLPYIGVEVKEFFEHLKKDVDPDVILTHRRDDLHQDHRFVAELTWTTWRDHLILEYEVPKWDGDLASADTYVHVPDRLARRKVAAIMRHFATQRGRHWFDEETFFGLMRLRGLECNAPERWAEAFWGRKICL